MYIEGRKKKKCSEKLVAEVTLYILTHNSAIFAWQYDSEFGCPSERTIYRYTKDIELCGYSPRIRLEAGEYTSWNEDCLPGLERENPPQSDDPQIRRLSRILEIYDEYSGAYYDALYPDGGDYEDGITDGPICPDVSSSAVLELLQKKHPDEPITLRTVQRDLAVIAEALEHYRNIYL